jgi:hypothetical protein
VVDLRDACLVTARSFCVVRKDTCLVCFHQNTNRLTLQANHYANELLAPCLRQAPTVERGVLVIYPVHPTEEVDFILSSREYCYGANEIGGKIAEG